MEPAVINALEPREFRRVLGHFATGVTVVTAEHDGKPFGATISAFSALSAEPPTILVCLNQNLGTHAAIQESGQFTINILGEEQGELARTFATPNADKFGSAAWAATSHGPQLSDAIAHLGCRVVETHEGGTHRIFIGLVQEATTVTGRGPLSYFRGQFGRFLAHDTAS
jgi:4-nitrophenol 2-monooxygenase / 4-nitrocatechol 4-monooxygenase, reductase component